MSAKESKTYYVNGRTIDIADVPGSTHGKYKNRQCIGYQGTYPSDNGKRKYFFGKDKDDVNIKRIMHHFSMDDNNNDLIAEESATQKAAVMATEAEKAVANPSLDGDDNEITVSEACNIYLKYCYDKGIAAKTFESYESNYRVYTKKYLGEIPISKLSCQDIMEMIGEMKCTRQVIRKDQKVDGLSYRTISYTVKMLSYALKYVIDVKDLNMRNVANSVYVKDMLNGMKKAVDREDKVKLMNCITNGTDNSKALKKDDARKFIQYAFESGDRLAIGYLFSICYGARPGEVAGLHWPNIIRDKGIVYIDRDLDRVSQYEYNDGEFQKDVQKTVLGIGDVKSNHSIRHAFVSVKMFDVFDRHKTILEKEKQKYSRGYKHTDCVLCTKRGTITENRNYARSFNKNMKHLGMVGYTPKSLRAKF